MGWFKDGFPGRVDGHDVLVQVRSGPIATRLSLTIDGEVQDTVKGVTGDHWLRGSVPGMESKTAQRALDVRVNLHYAGLGGFTCWAVVGGVERKLGEGFIL